MNKHSDPIFAIDIDWANGIPKLHKRVMDDAAAQKALAELVAGGCDATLLLQRLYMFSSGSQKQVIDVKNAYSRGEARLKKLSRDLKHLALEIKWAETFLSDIGVEYSNDLADRLTHYAEDTLDRFEPILKELGNKRITGRDHHLVFLAKYVETMTGRQHYAELATLVDVIRGANAKSSAESIRRRVDRSVLDAESYDQLIRLAKNERQRNALKADFQKRLPRK